MMAKKTIVCLALLIVLLITQPGLTLKPGAHSTASAQSLIQNVKVYFPMIVKQPSLPKVFGIYEQGFWHLSNQQLINDKLLAADTWAGKKHTIVGFFFDMNLNEYEYSFKGQLEALWKNGYVPFVNLNANVSAAALASGQWDFYITAMAKSYASWVNQGGGRKAFLAPLPEMNGDWKQYGQDATGFKSTYGRIQTIFANNGAPMNKAWWVFAPNGWSGAGYEFEKFYPGNDKVDIVGFSSYNYGYCTAVGAHDWENYDTLYAPYLTRMRAMAPAKPILITQTGTVAASLGNLFDRAKKDKWLIDNYNYLASQPGVLGILYYDYDLSSAPWPECDYSVFSTPAGIAKFDGYKTAVANPAFSYVSPANLSTMNLVMP